MLELEHISCWTVILAKGPAISPWAMIPFTSSNCYPSLWIERYGERITYIGLLYCRGSTNSWTLLWMRQQRYTSRMWSQDENLVRPLHHFYLHCRLQLYPRSYFAERRQHNANPASGIDPTFPFLCCTKNRGLRVLVMYNDASILFPIASPSCDPYFHRLYIGRSFVKLRDCLHNGHSA